METEPLRDKNGLTEEEFLAAYSPKNSAREARRTPLPGMLGNPWRLREPEGDGRRSGGTRARRGDACGRSRPRAGRTLQHTRQRPERLDNLLCLLRPRRHWRHREGRRRCCQGHLVQGHTEPEGWQDDACARCRRCPSRDILRSPGSPCHRKAPPQGRGRSGPCLRPCRDHSCGLADAS